jgi:hypothetical protein
MYENIVIRYILCFVSKVWKEEPIRLAPPQNVLVMISEEEPIEIAPPNSSSTTFLFVSPCYLALASSH